MFLGRFCRNLGVTRPKHSSITRNPLIGDGSVPPKYIFPCTRGYPLSRRALRLNLHSFRGLPGLALTLYEPHRYAFIARICLKLKSL